MNVAHYAYPDATPDNPGIARVSYTYSADPPSVRVDIADDGGLIVEENGNRTTLHSGEISVKL